MCRVVVLYTRRNWDYTCGTDLVNPSAKRERASRGLFSIDTASSEHLIKISH